MYIYIYIYVCVCVCLCVCVCVCRYKGIYLKRYKFKSQLRFLRSG